MDYIAIWYYIFILIIFFLYYIIPLKYRWILLLSGSMFFYYNVLKEQFICLIYLIIVSWVLGKLLYYMKKQRSNKCLRLSLIIAIVIVLGPLSITKYAEFFLGIWIDVSAFQIIAPIGISFYTLQMISYLVDIYNGKYQPEKNLFKYSLFISFFPQVIQGPIARYNELGEQLYKGHRFEEKAFVKGLHLILWGFFLKMMIADKAAIVVNTVFENYENYTGVYILVAGILYSVQLYADFLACVTISQGVAALFGIHIKDNFNHPYMATSVKKFWRKWHTSLSEWLRDYIYIPLGGNRKGRWRKYINLIATFLVSGMWHGAGYKFLIWGLIHAGYQIVGEMTKSIRGRIYSSFHLREETKIRIVISRIVTFFCVMLAWIIFRADGLKIGIKMLCNILIINFEVLLDGSLLTLGLEAKEMTVLLASIAFLMIVSCIQEKGCIRDYILKLNMVYRWGIYILVVLIIMVFGTYGVGFNSQDFIYGGF